MNLDDLRKALDALSIADVNYKPYHLSTKNTLPDPWWVFIPGAWTNQNENPPAQSPLEKAVLAGFNAAAADSANTAFLDLAHLGPTGGSDFFKDNPNLHDSLKDLVGKKSKVTLRYLEGNPPGNQFDQNADGNRNPITNQLKDVVDQYPDKLALYYGNLTPFLGYGPTAQEATQEILQQAIRPMLDAKPELKAELGAAAELDAIEEFVLELIGLMIPSWNHSKLVAVNGHFLLQGGGNFWSDYKTGGKSPFDMMTVSTGDCAVDAHAWCDFVWRYISSQKGKTAVCQKYSASTKQFGSDEHPAMFPGGAQNTGTIGVLTAGNLGLWLQTPGTTKRTIVYLVLDALLNLIYPIAMKYGKGWLIAGLTTALFGNEIVSLSSYAASRYARSRAIFKAQTNLRFSQQKFGMDDLYEAVPNFASFKDRFNKYFGTNWDGVIWDFDLINAIAAAAKGKSFHGVEIVSSCYIGNSNDHGNYQDPASSQQFKALVSMFAGTDVGSKITYRRISSSRSFGNHSKLIIIDDTATSGALLSIGSENAYPSYNQEFGIWIEDSTAIKKLVNEYWQPLWANSVADN